MDVLCTLSLPVFWIVAILIGVILDEVEKSRGSIQWQQRCKRQRSVSPELVDLEQVWQELTMREQATHEDVTQEQKQARAKVENERFRQLQEENRLFCEELVTKFWNDYLESSEETSILLERLKVALQNSDYQKWQEEFYDVVAKRARESIRPSKEQRQQSDANKSTEDLGGIRLNFNGIFVTSQQYQILSKNAKAWTLSPDDLIILCRKLAETMPEFRDFLDGKIIRTPQSLMDNNEAYALFGLTFETLTEASLKQAYRYLIQLYHPDKNQNAKAKEMFQKVQSYHAYLEAELRRKAA